MSGLLHFKRAQLADASEEMQKAAMRSIGGLVVVATPLKGSAQLIYPSEHSFKRSQKSKFKSKKFHELRLAFSIWPSAFSPYSKISI